MRLSRFDTNVENVKRRAALFPLDVNSKMFFDRILEVKKIRELIFVTKSKAKGR